MKVPHHNALGESRADTLLEDIVDLAPDKNVKLGFQAHFPQLETKLHVRGNSKDSIEKNFLDVNIKSKS